MDPRAISDPQGYAAAIMQHQKQQQLLQAAAQRERDELARQMAWQQEYERRMGEGFAGPATSPPDYTPVGGPGQYHTSQSPEARKWQPLASGAVEPSWSPIEELATAGIGGAVIRGLRGAAGRMVGRGARPTPQPTPQPRTAPHTEVTPLDRRLSSVGTEAEAARVPSATARTRVLPRHPARVPQGGLETRGRPGGRHGTRANWEAEKRLARLRMSKAKSESRWEDDLRGKGYDRETARGAARARTEKGYKELAQKQLEAARREAARREAAESSERVLVGDAQPMPRPAPGTRVKSTGPGVRRLTDAEKELMRENAERYRREAGRRGAAESSERMAPAQVPQVEPESSRYEDLFQLATTLAAKSRRDEDRKPMAKKKQ